MKLPLEIKNLTELHNWILKRNPERIEIRRNCRIKDIKDFRKPEEWVAFDGVPIKYLYV